MGIKYTMPVAGRTESDNFGDYKTNLGGKYKPLPHEAGKTFTNELYIPLYQPDKWEIFNKSREDVSRLGLTDGNPMASLGDTDPTVYTYHFKVPVHTIPKFERPDGTTGHLSFICPYHFNDYLEKIMGKRKLFKSSECPFCKAKTKAWDDHNDRWNVVIKERNLDEKPRGQKYRDIVEADPILKESYNRARFTYSLDYKYIFNVLDYGKITGVIGLAEGEENSHQYWLAPKKVATTLSTFYTEDEKDGTVPFFAHDDPNGFQIIKVVKDTTSCTVKSLRETEYTVMKGNKVHPADAWRSFMTNLDLMSDPSDSISIISFQEMQKYATPQTTSMNVPVTKMGPPPEQAPAVNVQAPPVVPVATQAPPVATQAPPVTTQAPPVATQAPPVTTQAPPAPQMTPPVPAMSKPEQTPPPPDPSQVPAQTPPPPAQVTVPSVPTPPNSAPAMTPPVPAMAPPTGVTPPDRGDNSDQSQEW